MAFPPDFPSVGEWDISYYENNKPVHTERMFVTEYLGEYKLMRQKTKYGWDFRTGDRSNYLMQSSTTLWCMYTWMSVIYLTAAKKVQ
jgi:hypothetical protein